MSQGLQSRALPLALLISSLIVSSSIVFLAVQLNRGFERRLNVDEPTASDTSAQAGVKASRPGSARLVDSPSNSRPTPNVFSEPRLLDQLNSDDHVYGSRKATKSFIVFMSFKCGFCSAIYPTLSRVVDESNGAVNLVFKHFPLGNSDSPDPLHNAAECFASIRGEEGFYSFVKDAYGPKKIDPAAVVSYVTAKGVQSKDEVQQFSECIAQSEFNPKIKKSHELGQLIGVTGTPAVVAVNRDNKKAVFQLGNLASQQLTAMLEQID